MHWRSDNDSSVEPCEKYLQSYIEAYDEYKLNDVQTYAFDDARAYNIFEKIR